MGSNLFFFDAPLAASFIPLQKTSVQMAVTYVSFVSLWALFLKFSIKIFSGKSVGPEDFMKALGDAPFDLFFLCVAFLITAILSKESATKLEIIFLLISISASIASQWLCRKSDEYKIPKNRKEVAKYTIFSGANWASSLTLFHLLNVGAPRW